MKKGILYTIVVIGMSLLLGSCGGGEDQSSSLSNSESSSISMIIIEDENVKVNESLAKVVMENNLISVAFDLDNGSMMSLKNRQTQTDYLNNSVGGNWAMAVDVSTKDPFQTDYLGNNSHLVSSRNQEVEYHKSLDATKGELTFTYDVEFTIQAVKYTGIKVVETITLTKGSNQIKINYEIENNCNKDVVIVNFTGSQLSGIKDSTHENLKLFWPNKEGKIYDDAISKIYDADNQDENLVEVYPSLASMQLVQLFNNVESLYYIIEDSTREYKTLNYGDFTSQDGYDYNGVSSEDKLSLSATQFPFIPSNSTKSLFPTVIGVAVGETWYQGADVYREFLSQNKMVKEVSDFTSSWSGFTALVGSSYGSKHFASYVNAEGFTVSYPNWVELADESGIDTVTVLGWNDGGFDAKFPDYEFATGPGFNGAEGFIEMTQQIHNNGDYIFAHMNSRIADVQGKWSNTVFNESTGILNIHQAGVKSAGFDLNTGVAEYEDFMLYESYGSGTYYYVMCPGSIEFQTVMNNNIKRLREANVNGLWFDQLLEKVANLCYDPSHNHTTPATAYGEGYGTMLEMFNETARTTGDGEWMIVAGGGGSDAYAEWVDVAGGNWNRKLGARDNSDNSDRQLMSPEIIRYVVSSTYLGLESAGTVSGQADEYARAFVYGDPFLGDPYKTSTAPLLSLYESYPDIFYDGRFMDRVGLSISNDEIISAIILGNTSKSFAIQVYNFSSETALNTSFAVNLSKLGITGTIKSVENAFTGDSLSVNDGQFIVPNLDSLEMGSYYVVYE